MTENIKLASGVGQYHTNKNGRELDTVTVNRIYEQAINPTSVHKSKAPWFIPSVLLTRNFDDQRTNGMFCALVGDIDKTTLDIEELEKVVDQLGCDFLSYTTRSATLKNKKYRIFIPLLNPISGLDFERCEKVLNDFLEDNGITPDRSTERAGQLHYLPNRGKYYESVSSHLGLYLDVEQGLFGERLAATIDKAPKNRKIKTENRRLKKITEMGLLKTPSGNGKHGKHNIHCINEENHSSRSSDSSTVFYEANYNGYSTDNFDCKHVSCEGLNIGDLDAILFNPSDDFDDINDDPFGMTALQQYEKRFVFVERFGKQYSGVADLDRPANDRITPLGTFKHSKANEMAISGDNKTTALATLWIKSLERKTVPSDAYTPGADDIYTDDQGMKRINTFCFPTHANITGTDRLDVFHQHLVYLIPAEDERDLFVGWMAHMIQHPQIRCNFTPLHVSEPHGTGRGAVVQIIGKLLGMFNCSKTKMPSLCGDGSASAYQDHMYRNICCFLEEVREGGKRYEVNDKIRDYLSEPYLELNLKYGLKGTYPIYTRYFLMSNHRDALNLPEGDRRIFVISGPDYLKSNDYYSQLYTWMDDTKNIAQLFHWLNRYDLSNFNYQRALKTPGRSAMIRNGLSDTEVAFKEMLDDPPYLVMTYRQISSYMNEMATSDDDFFSNISEPQLTQLLRMHAHQPLDGQLAVGTKRVRPWLLGKESNISRDDMREILISASEKYEL